MPEPTDIILPTEPTEQLPTVRTISISDLRTALRKGLADFWAMPTHVIFLSLIYPVAGLLIGRATFGGNFIALLFPLAAGFALLGPFAAIGLYELSRRRELGLDTSWRHALDIIHSPSFKSILALGALLLLLFSAWIAAAQAIYTANFGDGAPASIAAFADSILTTRQGLNLMIFGNLAGLLFAIVAFVISVVSFPLLLDRDVGVTAAIITSVKVVVKNPMIMGLWGLFVAGALILGSLPLFIGLAVVMPILGHATWHLYRTVILPDAGRRPEFRRR